MAKKKNRAKFPKRIAGVKIPKAFRRFADSPVGGNMVAAGLMFGAYKVANSDTARQVVARLRDEVTRAEGAMNRFADRKRRRSYDDQDFRESPAN